MKKNILKLILIIVVIIQAVIIVALIVFLMIVKTGCVYPENLVDVNWKNKHDSHGEYTEFEYMGYDFERFDDTFWYVDESKMEYIGQLKVCGFERRERPDNLIQLIPFLRFNSYTDMYCYYNESKIPLIISNGWCQWINSEVVLLSEQDTFFSCFSINDIIIFDDFQLNDVIEITNAKDYSPVFVKKSTIIFYSKDIECLYSDFRIYEESGTFYLERYLDPHTRKCYAFTDKWQKIISDCIDQ